MSWLRHLNFKLLYFRKPPWDTQISPPELMEFIAQYPPGRALDLGCGTGTNVITLAQHGWRVTGVDYVGHALRQAKKKAQLAGVKADFQADDVTKLKNIAGVFDLVLDIGCFHSLDTDEKRAYIHNLERLTTPGSIYLIYGFFREADGKGSGLRDSDLRGFEISFDLINREEGFDRRQRPSVWVTYQRKPADKIDQGIIK
jgi:SAM-dependent methyltransferase